MSTCHSVVIPEALASLEAEPESPMGWWLSFGSGTPNDVIESSRTDVNVLDTDPRLLPTELTLDDIDHRWFDLSPVGVRGQVVAVDLDED